jgi:hypothetical protein
MVDFWYDLGVNLLAGFIGFGCGAVVTYFSMGRFLDRRLQQQKLAEARPIAKEVIGYRLWPILRIVILQLTQMALTPTQRLRRSDVFFAYVQENHYAFIFDQIEKLIDIYGDRIPDDIQKDLIEFGQNAGILCESISRIKANWQIASSLDEWANLKPDAGRLASEADDLVKKLVQNGALSEELAERYQLLRREALSRGEGYMIPYGGKPRILAKMKRR